MAGIYSRYWRMAGCILLVCLAGYAVFSLLWQNIRIYGGLPEKEKTATLHPGFAGVKV